MTDKGFCRLRIGAIILYFGRLARWFLEDWHDCTSQRFPKWMALAFLYVLRTSREKWGEIMLTHLLESLKNGESRMG